VHNQNVSVVTILFGFIEYDKAMQLCLQ
jgi:hypothetical protein